MQELLHQDTATLVNLDDERLGQIAERLDEVRHEDTFVVPSTAFHHKLSNHLPT